MTSIPTQIQMQNQARVRTRIWRVATFESSLPALPALPALLALSLAACGGGGGSVDAGGAPPPPVPENVHIDAQPVKRLQVGWDDGTDEDRYRLLLDSDGHSGFSLLAELPADTTDFAHATFLPDAPTSRYVVEACAGEACSASAPVSPSAEALTPAIGKVKAANAQAGDLFGNASALSADGRTLVVAAPGEASQGTQAGPDDNSAPLSGAVYVYTRIEGGAWQPQAYLKAVNAGAADVFGQAVALSADGRTLAVGAYLEDSSATGIDGDGSDNSAADSGAVYVFTQDANGNWQQQAYIKPTNTGSGDTFGNAVALSADGDWLAVGAPTEDSAAQVVDGDAQDDSASDAGAAYVFMRTAGVWTQQAYLKAANAGAGDRFGWALAIDGDGRTLAVAAHTEDSAASGVNGNAADDTLLNSGASYVFVRNGTQWTQQAYLKASNPGVDDLFGDSIAIAADGHTLAVGAINESSAVGGVNGAGNDDGATDAGAAYVFVRNGEAWMQQAYLKAPLPEISDEFGQSIALSASGDLLAVGAVGEDAAAAGLGGTAADNASANSGAAFLFRRAAGAWSEAQRVKARDPGSFDRFGWSLALAADAQTLVVAAPREDSDAAGVNELATDSGAVYLY